MPATSKKPRRLHKVTFPAKSASNSTDASTPGPPGKQPRQRSLVDDLKAATATKARDAKNRAKLTVDKRKLLAVTKEKKQVANITPDAPAAKKRKIHFSSSAELINTTNLPLNPMLAVIEKLGFTPNAEVERELLELDDVLRPKNGFEDPSKFNDLDDLTPAETIQTFGTEADSALRVQLDSKGDRDLLLFDWRGDYNYFEGVREVFTGQSGPTFQVTGLTPLKVLQKIWDDDIVDHIVHETNRYATELLVKTASEANSRMTRWRDTTREEYWRFLTVIMLQSLVVNDVEREYWYPSNEQLRIGAFEKIMSYNRFTLLKRCLYFIDNTFLPENKSKLDKVMPIIKHLNKKFSTLYLPEQNVAINQSFLLCKRQVPFAQSLATKKARVGIKNYELCESRTGYLWKVEVYSGKGHVRAPQGESLEGHKAGNEPENTTSQIVYKLMRPLFGKGHTLVMDNFCNAPLLSRLLKTKHKTDTMGTLRLNRNFVPEALKCKNKNNMKMGEVCSNATKDLSVVVWKANNVVPMISTFHPPKVGGKEKCGYYKYKPKVVLDYNLAMAGVDRKDQMLHAFPIEGAPKIYWHKKIFRRLINVSVHNTLVMYNHDRSQQIGNRDFRLQLVQEMLQMYSPQAITRPPPPATLSQMHLPVKNEKNQRCKLCYEAKMRRSTVWRCSTCQVNLCIERCYTTYHANLKLT